jgi:hypothetical protein
MTHVRWLPDTRAGTEPDDLADRDEGAGPHLASADGGRPDRRASGAGHPLKPAADAPPSNRETTPHNRLKTGVLHRHDDGPPSAGDDPVNRDGGGSARSTCGPTHATTATLRRRAPCSAVSPRMSWGPDGGTGRESRPGPGQGRGPGLDRIGRQEWPRQITSVAPPSPGVVRSGQSGSLLSASLLGLGGGDPVDVAVNTSVPRAGPLRVLLLREVLRTDPRTASSAGRRDTSLGRIRDVFACGGAAACPQRGLLQETTDGAPRAGGVRRFNQQAGLRPPLSGNSQPPDLRR